MKLTHPLSISLMAGGLAAAATFVLSAFAQNGPSSVAANENLETAIFAGGCFWCVESDFDKLDGVLETVSGYTGGATTNPTYKTHTKQGHLEAVKVVYDSSKVEYGELVDYFIRHIDPTDDGGQFCDRGNSYRTAVFVNNAEERAEVEAQFATIENAGILPAPIVTRVLEETAFYDAEGYHQNYYQKNPARYKLYRVGCGRDKRVAEVWSGAGAS
ncbi:MAG: peptide-methionine (S)-S-oxide reductase MsrA [Henriciella sp.]|nr:peptide-methionine (S)-S-oxide reductase MsrA [Henriciella sp.]